MNQEKKRELNPKLRFPEFHDAEEWEDYSFYDLLEDVLDFRGRTPLKLGMEWGGGNVISLSANNVKNGYIDYDAECNFGSQDLYEKWMGKVNLEKNDIVFTMEAPLGNALLIPDSNKYILSQRVVAFKTKTEVNNFFLIQLIWCTQFQSSIDKLATGSTAKGINQKSLKKVYVKIPSSKEEQQKIADCLSSLDDRITAETQKLDTLKVHKKGLMQQFFPAEGKTLPKLRFPEFRDAPEWEEYSIAKLVKENILFAPKDGNHGNLHPKSSDYVEMGIPFVMANDFKNGAIDFSRCTHITKELADSLQKGFAEEGDVLLTHKGTVGEVALIKKIEFPYLMLTPQVTYYRIKDKSKLSNKFLAVLFASESFQRFLKVAAGGGTRAYIGITEQGKLKITFPTNILEQQKIADCLSSLNELIAAQTQKIDTLKVHKKGLMQQLFPSVDEVRG